MTRIPLHPSDFRGDLFNHRHVTKLGKVIESEEQVDFWALFLVVRNTGNVQTDRKLLTDEDVSKSMMVHS